MATSPQEARQALTGVTSGAVDSLHLVWGSLAIDDAAVARDALIEWVPDIAETWGDAAAVLAADWYDDLRDAAGAAGSFVAEPAALPGTARYEALVRWGLAPLFSPEPDTSAALTLISGGLQRIVANAHRDTLMGAARVDVAAHGWRRLTSSGSCNFCRMLAGRGEVYRKDTARFGSHDHCYCMASPAFEPGRAVKVEQYAATKRNVTATDRERVRSFMAHM